MSTMTRKPTTARAEDQAAEALAMKYFISIERARELIERFGDHPERLESEARKLVPPTIEKDGRA